jgi:hypothetical protein
MVPVGNLSKKTRYDICDRHGEEEPERRERAEERDGCSQRVDDEREHVLDRVEPRGLKSRAFLLPRRLTRPVAESLGI